MKGLVKAFLITGIVVCALVSAKILVEFFDTKVKRYINVD